MKHQMKDQELNKLKKVISKGLQENLDNKLIPIFLILDLKHLLIKRKLLQGIQLYVENAKQYSILIAKLKFKNL